MSEYPALRGCLWWIAKMILLGIAMQIVGHFADHVTAHLILERGWNALTVTKNQGAFEMLVLVFAVLLLFGDRGSDRNGENTRSVVEGEASQNGPAQTGHRPNPPTTGVLHG